MKTKPYLLGVLLLAGLGPAAGAQPVKPGDLVLSGFSFSGPAPYTGIFAMDPQGLRVQTLVFEPGTTRIHQWVGMLERNTDLGVLTFNLAAPPSPGTGEFSRLKPGGPLQAVARMKAPAQLTRTNDPTGAIWDPAGRLLIASGLSLYLYDPTTGRLTTAHNFAAGPTVQPLLQGVAIGPGKDGRFQENYYALSAFGAQSTLQPAPPFLFRFDPKTRQVTTLDSTRLARATSLIYDLRFPPPLQRRFLITQGGSAGALLAVDFTTAALKTIVRVSGFSPDIVKAAKRQDTVYVAGHRLTMPTRSEVLEVDVAQGAITRVLQVPVPGGFQTTGLEVYGANTLQPRGRLPLGSLSITFDLVTNNAALAGKSYWLALALDPSPPAATLVVGGTPVTLDLAPDPLFFTSAFSPGAVGLAGSMGTLDTMGNAQATMIWPYGKTGGLTIYAAWIAYDNTGILHVSETEPFLLP